MASRRDLGAGVVSTRPGRTASRMAGPWSLTVRLHRTSLVLWTTGVAGMSLLFGVMAPGFDDLLDTAGGRELMDRLGGAFVAVLLPVAAMGISVFPVSVIHRALHDEDAGRTDLALATGASRRRWFTATAALGALGAAWLLAVAGTSLWGGYRAAGGTATASTVAAAVGWTPAVCVVAGIALLGFSLRMGWLGWTGLVVSVTLTLVGELLELPDWLVRLSPFSALPAYPVEAWRWPPLLVLAMVALGLTVVAWRVFSGRDLG